MADIKLFIYGIDNAGKTAISETVKRETTFDKTKPTIRVMVSQTILKNLNFYIWDMPGQTGLRDKWAKALERSDALIFILDTADRERYHEAKEEFYSILNNPESNRVPLIFCFHKMDLEEAKTNLPEAQKAFELENIKGRTVNILETSVKELNTIDELKDKMVSLFID